MEAKSEPLMRVPVAVSNPKPKAKDPNKREMSWEERQELGIGLQSLPPEKIGHVVDILTKRNRNLQDKEEFEVNVEDLDTETIWELDRFVTNYMMSHRVSEIDVVPAAASNLKPKAKDPNKRAMSMEEKHKLEIGLQSLPQEKLVHVALILTKRKRNGNLLQLQYDDIDIDLDALDLETVRELDRFVTKYRRIS